MRKYENMNVFIDMISKGLTLKIKKNQYKYFTKNAI